MTVLRAHLTCLAFLLLPLAPALAQTILTYEQARAWMMDNHPLAEAADAVEERGPAAALAARGALDPKINFEYDRKEFKGSEYWDNGWGEIEWQSPFALKFAGGYERAEGIFLNEEETLPAAGQAYLAVKLPLLRGLVRDATRIGLRRGELAVDRQIAIADILRNELHYDLAVLYYEWAYAYRVAELNQTIVLTLEDYLINYRQLYFQGDKPAVDTLEASVYLNQARQDLQTAAIEFAYASQALQELYWPLQPDDIPVPPRLLPPSGPLPVLLESQPELRELAVDLADINLERSLKAEDLKPQLDMAYYLLGEGFDIPETAATPLVESYKLEIRASYPIFNRKARGSLQEADLKIVETRAKLEAKTQALRTKAEVYDNAVDAYNRQLVGAELLVEQSEALRDAERELFRLGESDQFLINAREQTLLKSRIDLAKLIVGRGKAIAALRYITGSWEQP